jgi:type II secretion system protein N
VKERLKKIAPKVGFPLFYLFCLLLFASWTFPYERLKERIVVTFNAQQRATNSNQELQIDELTSSWLTGIKAKGVRLITAASEAGKPPTELKIEEARARISLLGLLVGNKDVSFKLSAFGGSVDGSFDDHGKERAVEVNLDGLELGQVDPITAALGIPMEGKLTGLVKLVMPEGKASKANGALTMEIKDVAVGNGKAKLGGALPLPRMNIGTLTFTAEAKDGVFKVTKLAAGGKDLELNGEGRIQMRELATDSLIDMNARFKVNDGYRMKNNDTKALFGEPGSKFPAMFDLDPKVKQSKRADGYYGWHLKGSLGKPEPEPQQGGALLSPGLK